MAALSQAELAAMVDDAVVDAYGEDEQAMGFHAVLVDNVKMPFVTSVLGVEVTVEDIDLAEDNSILAICARNGSRQAIRVWISRCRSRRPRAPSGSVAAANARCDQ